MSDEARPTKLIIAEMDGEHLKYFQITGTQSAEEVKAFLDALKRVREIVEETP